MGATPLINQVLHGYSDGHRKLAGSCSLPRDAERQLLILSDLPGPGGGDYFEPYLTGYPVESAGCYALARTWPARERGRPGCVWTHTLLITDELLAELAVPEILLGVFRRPSVEVGFREYAQPITLPQTTERFQARDWGLGAELIRAMYTGTDSHTVLAVPNYSVAEIPFLAIWALQWESLHKRFTFCTGARHGRTLDGRLFQLQAALPRDMHRVARLGSKALALVPDGSLPVMDMVDWIKTAASAYAGIDDSLLKFFSSLGSTVPAEIELFRPLVETFNILARHRGSIGDLLKYAAMEFPSADEGREYKRAIFGANVAGLAEAELIRTLSFSRNTDIFDLSSLRIHERSAKLWSDEREAWELLANLATARPNRIGQEAIAGLTSAIPPYALGQAATWPEVLRTIIWCEPALAQNPHIWDLRHRQEVVVDAIIACRDQLTVQADDIICTALNADADPLNPSLFDAFGASTTESTLRWLDAHPFRRIPKGWQSALHGRSAEMLDWLSRTPVASFGTVLFVVTNAKPEQALASPHLPGVLQNFFAEASEEAAISAASKYLHVALKENSPYAVEIACATFDVVYRALATSRLADDLWHHLAPALPSPKWWQEWDHCEQLRRGVAEKFCNGEWPASKLPSITNDDHVFAKIISELRERFSGLRVIQIAAEYERSAARREEMLGE